MVYSGDIRPEGISMKTYNLPAKVTVSAYTAVEAESLEDAIKQAQNREYAVLDNGVSEKYTWVIDDADCMAQDIREKD